MSVIETYALIVGTEKCDAERMAKYPYLRVVSRVGSGIDNIDQEYCKEHGIAIENTPDAPVQAVAEYVVYQIMNTIRDYKGSSWTCKIRGKEVKDLTIGIIGNGNIGSKVYNLLYPFGCKLLTNDVIPDISDTTAEDIFANCDVVTIHIPLNPPNYHFIDKRLLLLMKPDAILINTSRGDIINEEDLFEHLVCNPDTKAILDVFSKEPYDGMLKGLRNTVLTPHIASCTKTAKDNMEKEAHKNAMKYYLK